METAINRDHTPIRGLSTKNAAAYLGVSDSYLRKTRLKDKDPDKGWAPGPRYKKLGSKVVYTIEALDEFLDQLPTQAA